ncbi:CAAX prenyl protease 2 [Sesamum angolense]|uniref:intramembrane prenyl-peptidase Rce1 n=1 Tax=Sesamum angolense TaxID=2727404 RepID=A0AAE1WNB9_9LAMI|nr:CAAX prenyl protease 2 [Sesamum angolense]
MYPIEDSDRTLMEQQDGGAGLTKSAAVGACTAMAVFYVAILYSPTLILRLPPPNSFKSFMIRRFVCAAVSSLVSLIVCSLILPIRRRDASNLLWVYGIRVDHIWQALVFPLSLTSFMYTGSFAWKLLSMLQASNEHLNSGGNELVIYLYVFLLNILSVSILLGTAYGRVGIQSLYDSSATLWRFQYLHCHISLSHIFQFSSFEPLTGVLLPTKLQFSQSLHGCSQYIACFSAVGKFPVLGVQLGYTVIFGAYASFLLVRTGHLTAPLIAHIFCNFMGLPVIVSRRSVNVVKAKKGTKQALKCRNEIVKFTHLILDCDILDD